MPILMRARAMPMVRTIRPMQCFCSAKTCSTAERMAERFALALATRSGKPLDALAINAVFEIGYSDFSDRIM